MAHKMLHKRVCNSGWRRRAGDWWSHARHY